jgi:ring-1,2-phenylacetyl-CoA epoxidase subunit PaaE
MAAHFHSLVVKEIRRETADCVSVLLDVPANLQAAFTFTQGQNITIKKQLDGQEIRRSYSICSAPYQNELKVAIKKVPGGKFSHFANEKLQQGDMLDVMSPVGKFNTTLCQQQQKHYAAFAAGSGITPVISIIKQTLATEPNSRFTLVYGNKTRSAVIFFEELEALKNKYLQRFQLIHIFSREHTDTPISHGRINTAKLIALGQLLPYQQIHDFFICGPQQMLFEVKDFLTGMGVKESNIHFELFAAQGTASLVIDHKKLAGDNCELTVVADGRTMHFNYQPNTISILDAALQQGADLPYACKGGMCCTCKARLIEGQVAMNVHWGLEEAEIKQGFILTCQSHPLTQKIIIDFDAR